MREESQPWIGHQKVTVWPLAYSGEGAVGLYDRFLAKVLGPEGGVDKIVNSIDLSTERGVVSRVLIQSLNSFESSTPKERALHSQIFIALMNRFQNKSSTPFDRSELEGGLHNLVRACQMQYNRGNTADPNKTAELLKMVHAVDRAGLLTHEHAFLKDWAVAQEKWETQSAAQYRAHLDAERIAASTNKRTTSINVPFSRRSTPSYTPIVLPSSKSTVRIPPAAGRS